MTTVTDKSEDRRIIIPTMTSVDLMAPGRIPNPALADSDFWCSYLRLRNLWSHGAFSN